MGTQKIKVNEGQVDDRHDEDVEVGDLKQFPVRFFDVKFVDVLLAAVPLVVIRCRRRTEVELLVVESN